MLCARTQLSGHCCLVRSQGALTPPPAGCRCPPRPPSKRLASCDVTKGPSASAGYRRRHMSGASSRLQRAFLRHFATESFFLFQGWKEGCGGCKQSSKSNVSCRSADFWGPSIVLHWSLKLKEKTHKSKYGLNFMFISCLGKKEKRKSSSYYEKPECRSKGRMQLRVPVILGHLARP